MVTFPPVELVRVHSSTAILSVAVKLRPTVPFVRVEPFAGLATVSSGFVLSTDAIALQTSMRGNMILFRISVIFFPVFFKAVSVCPGVSVNSSSFLYCCMSATAPATCGADIDVPDFTEVPPLIQEAVIELPGARRSVMLLVLLKLDISSDFVVDATDVTFLMH